MTTDNNDTSMNVLNKAEIANQLQIINSRAETLSIIINILNAFLGLKQQSATPFSDEIIAAIQAAINSEHTKTERMFKEIEQSMNAGGINNTNE